MPALSLTEEQRQDAARLKLRFQQWQLAQRNAGLPSSQEAISDQLGFNQSALSQYLNARIPLNISALLKFCKLMEVTPEEISPGLAENIELPSIPASTLNTDDLLKLGFKRVRVADDSDPYFTKIPKVKLRLSAGITGFEVEPEHYDGSTTIVPTAWMERNGLHRDKLIAIHVRGESMEPTFYDGDLVVLNTADNQPVDGAVYAINYEGEPLIKRMERDAGRWWLKSDNLDQRKHGRKVCQGDACLIVGRVVRKESTRF